MVITITEEVVYLDILVEIIQIILVEDHQEIALKEHLVMPHLMGMEVFLLVDLQDIKDPLAHKDLKALQDLEDFKDQLVKE